MLLKQVPAFFKKRRDALMKSQPGAIFLFPSSLEVLRNPDVHYPFRQESSFFYLTGFEEPESYLVLVPTSGSGGYQSILFVRKRDPELEIWEGERYGVEGAVSVFGVDEAYPIDELSKRLPDLLKRGEKVFYRIGMMRESDELVLNSLERARKSLGRSGKALLPIVDPAEVLGEMRLFKTPEELPMIRRACELTALAHRTAMKEVRPGMKEFEIEALIDYTFRRNGSQRVGYGSIVAGGVNAACLHYRANNDILRDHELLLVDAGGEFEYYTSDITRTFPIGREYTSGQAKLYDLVLKAQMACIEMARPGATMPGIHRKAVEVLTDGMLSLGLMKGNLEDMIQSLAYKRFYPHNTGHWLGMDVHDVGLYTQKGEPRKLQAGMFLTIEPGFYVQPGDRDVPEEYRNIGIRIEDDILITENGCENLTKDAPKVRSEIEALKN